VSETGKPKIGVITERLEFREECALTPVLVLVYKIGREAWIDRIGREMKRQQRRDSLNEEDSLKFLRE